MAKQNDKKIEELLKEILFAQLATQGVSQPSIAKIVGVSLGRVNPIAKEIIKAKRKGK